MTNVDLGLIGAALFLLSGLLAAVMPGKMTALLSGVAGAVTSWAGLAVLWGAPISDRFVHWAGLGGLLHFRLDPLSALFMVPLGVLGALGAAYAVRYRADKDYPQDQRRVRGLYGVLVASMCGVILSQDGIAFLVTWEIMALAAFALIATDHEQAEVRQASYIYLIATHVSTLCLWLIFSRIAAVTGEFSFARLPAGGGTTVTLLIGLVAFGLKAGLMPLHFWLPGAHASSPSHVSALMSGVLIKMGVYGMVRLASLATELPVGFGAMVFLLGNVSAVLGVVLALCQHDIKRLLAYHSVENIGIIFMGLGLALLGRSLHNPVLVMLGIAGGLLHVWNHAFFKGLLFFAGGAVIHATGIRSLDQLGGLAKRMPRTALWFFVGAVSICGLPPFNGFISEWFIYLGLFQSAHSFVAVALAAPVLALVGALALACFIKIFGALFLGVARTKAAAQAVEAPPVMLASMMVLGLLCATIGLLSPLLIPGLERVALSFAPEMKPEMLRLESWRLSLTWISGVGAIFLSCLATAWYLLGRFDGSRKAAMAPTWRCGYLAPTPRMQYTSSSFADTIVGLFTPIFKGVGHRPTLEGIYPAESHLNARVNNVILKRLGKPAVFAASDLFARVRVVQGGRVQIYILYIVLAVVLAMALQLPMKEWVEHLWAR